ncbi:MAG TPA: toll/interleukin-1 receptor domain-containing protein [Allosphingosinicella sp.]|jgi:hypothetical protein|nr:toll/interleukin-1 receptor domain-containing protein [Allosphingosinicella sp.]
MAGQEAEAAGPPRPKLFISYSRTDAAAVDRLEAGLSERGFEILRDVEDIAFGEEWWARLVQMIGEADTVIFMLTPRAAASPVCGKEVAEAHRRGKRIMPVLLEATDWNALPAALARINSFSLVGVDDGAYPARLDQLRDAMLVDLPWVREHSHIGAAAETWADGGRSPADLLAGTELRRALDWLRNVPPNAAEPTPLQREYIAASEAARHRRRVTLLASLATFSILLLAAAAIALLYRLDAGLAEARVALQSDDLAAAQQAMTDYARDPVARLLPATRTARQLASEILDRGTISGILRPGLRGDGAFESMEVADGALFLLRSIPSSGPRLIRCDFALTACESRALEPGWENASFVTDGTRLALTPAPPTEGFTSTVPVPTAPEAVATRGTPKLIETGGAVAPAARAGPHEASFPIPDNPPMTAPLARAALQCDEPGTLCLSLSQPPESTRAQIDAYSWRQDDNQPVRWVSSGTILPFAGDESPTFAVSRDGSRAAVGTGRTLLLWDGRLLASGEEQQPMRIMLPIEARDLRFTPDGGTLFIRGVTGILRLNLDLRGARIAGQAPPAPPEVAPLRVSAGLAWQAGDRSIVRGDGAKIVKRPLSAALAHLLDGGSWGAASLTDEGPFVFARADNGCPTDADGPTGADLILATSASAAPSLLLTCVQGVDQAGAGLAIAAGDAGRVFVGARGLAELIEWDPVRNAIRIHHVGAVRTGAMPRVEVEAPTIPAAGADGLVRLDLGWKTHAGPGGVGLLYAPAAGRLALLDPTDLLIYDLKTARLTPLPSRVKTTESSFDLDRRAWLSRNGRIAVLATPSNAGPVYVEMFDIAESRRLALPPGATAVEPRGADRYLITSASGRRCWSVPEMRGAQVGLLESLLRKPGRERPPIAC